MFGWDAFLSTGHSMKLCIFTNHFYPEDFKVNDIAFELEKKGHDVTVITAVPFLDISYASYQLPGSLLRPYKSLFQSLYYCGL